MANQEQPPKRKPTQASVSARAPWLPADWEIADAGAIQALQRGNATPDQQRRALEWIVMQASGTYDEPYRPGGPEGERDTSYALGRASVGRQIVKLSKMALSKLRGEVSEDG